MTGVYWLYYARTYCVAPGGALRDSGWFFVGSAPDALTAGPDAYWSKFSWLTVARALWIGSGLYSWRMVRQQSTGAVDCFYAGAPAVQGPLRLEDVVAPKPAAKEGALFWGALAAVLSASAAVIGSKLRR